MTVSVIFRSMFAASTGEARTHLTGANEAAADLAPFLKLVTGDMTPLQDHRLEPFKSLYSLVDKYECPSLRALLRSQMVLLNSCSQNSRIGIFLLAASDGNWPACAEALRTAQLGGKWANGGIPPRCVACCGKCKTPTGGIGLTSPDLKQTLLDPASLCVEHFAALTRYPAVLLALLRAIEFSKSRYTKVSHSAVSAMFLHLMMEHEREYRSVLCTGAFWGGVGGLSWLRCQKLLSARRLEHAQRTISMIIRSRHAMRPATTMMRR